MIGSVGGGYALTSALVACLASALSLAQVPRSEAVAAAALMGYLLYLAVLLWGFSVRSVARLWVTLAAGTALGSALVFLMRSAG